MARMILKEWLFRCDPCDKIFGLWIWNYEVDEQTCPACHQAVDLYVPERGVAPGIATDDIPGGVEIRHLSRKPERFYSKTDIKRACNERGFTWADDTPKPYRVRWSGKRNNESTAE